MVLFDSNSLIVPVLLDMNSKKRVAVFGSNFLKILLFFHMNSKNLEVHLWKCQYCLIWILKKCVQYSRETQKMFVLLYMKLKKVFTIVWYFPSENVSIVWYELWSCQYCLVVTLWKYQFWLIWILLLYSIGKITYLSNPTLAQG